ncbi:MAG: MFS transporter [Bacillota bacterium]|nr:MFS transporter [Bacillota bacterium]
MEKKEEDAILIVLFLGVLMGALDIAVIAPAFIKIQSAFNISMRHLVWIFSVYVLFNLISTPFMARLSDQFGRKRIFILGIFIFALGSFIVTISWTYPMVIIGRGIQGMGTNENDFVEHLLTTSTHDTILFFTNKGKVYRTKGYEIPEFSRTAKGIPIINLLGVEKGEWVKAVIPVAEFKEDWSLFFTTREGISKRSPLTSFANIRNNGLIALNLREEDELISVRLTDGTKEIIIGTKKGMLIRFPETDVRSMGRTATGVKGISLRKDDEVVGMEVLEDNTDILIVTKNGFGKRTPAAEYRIQGRGGTGIKTCNITDKNGDLVAVKAVTGEEDLMLITTGGVLIRMGVDGISTMGRSTIGVKLISLGESEDEYVATVAQVEKEDEKFDETLENMDDSESVDENNAADSVIDGDES